MARGAESHQIFLVIASPILSGHDVVHFQKTSSSATRRLATMFITRQNLPTHPGRDSRRVSATAFADRGVAADSVCIGFTQLAFARVGLDGHSSRFRIFVNVDLDWWAVR